MKKLHLIFEAKITDNLANILIKKGIQGINKDIMYIQEPKMFNKTLKSYKLKLIKAVIKGETWQGIASGWGRNRASMQKWHEKGNMGHVVGCLSAKLKV